MKLTKSSLTIPISHLQNNIPPKALPLMKRIKDATNDPLTLIVNIIIQHKHAYETLPHLSDWDKAPKILMASNSYDILDCGATNPHIHLHFYPYSGKNEIHEEVNNCKSMSTFTHTVAIITPLLPPAGKRRRSR